MKIFVHIDADPDNDTELVSTSLRQSPNSLHWNCLTSAIDTFEKYREKAKDKGFKFKAVFFLRADDQIKTAYGTSSYLFNEFHDRISESFSVGWHPHLLRWSESQKVWNQEFQDNQWIHAMLANCHDDLKDHGFEIKHTKMGWCFHNNITMKTLSDLGVKADFSALPRARSPGRSVGGYSFQDRYDWSRTKPYPYNPDGHDYQRQGNLRILEIPLTMYSVRGLKEFLFMMKTGLHSYRKPDLSYFPSFQRMVPVYLLSLVKVKDLRGFCESLIQRDRQYISIYLHPRDMLEPNSKNIFEDFISHIISSAEGHNLKISFADAEDLSNSLSSEDTGLKVV